MTTALEIINTLAVDEINTDTWGTQVTAALQGLANETGTAACSFLFGSDDCVTLQKFSEAVRNLAVAHARSIEKFVTLCDELYIFPPAPLKRLAGLAFEELAAIVFNVDAEYTPATADEFAASLWTVFTAD